MTYKISVMSTNSSKESTSSVTPASGVIPENVVNIRQDVTLLLNYAVSQGIVLPASLKANTESNLSTAISNYNQLVPAVAPATVQSIRYINSQAEMDADTTIKLVKIPIFKRCIIIAVLALIALIAVSLLPDVNEANLEAGLLSSSGLTLMYNLIFICSAALLGVMFYLLKTIGDKIKSYTLLPVDAIEINATIIIGVISGFILSELFTFSGSALSGDLEINKMTLALLGGFSSDAIFTVLQGIVNKFKQLFAPGNVSN